MIVPPVTEDPSRLLPEAVALSLPHRPHPNPRVGALVIAPTGVVVGKGAHTGPGSPHAEINALREAGALARGATMVVTLEPCSHFGLTPPCTEALIEAGVSKVVVGAIDPDVRVAGSGMVRLRAAGIEVLGPVDQCVVEASDPGYFHHRRTGRSRIVHKAALTLDGQIAAADGTSQWITSAAAREDAHELRAAMDAVMVGAGTLIADDPRLDVRLEGYAGPQPRAVVVAGSRPLPAHARIWDRDPLVLAPGPIASLGEVVVVPGHAGAVDLAAALRATADRGLLDVMVEGGSVLAAGLWEEGLVDAGVWYVAAMVGGGVGRAVFDRPFATLSSARRVDIIDVTRLGTDLRIDWVPSSG